MSIIIDLKGKKGIVFGVANQRSIAWAISKKLADAGAEIAFTYLNDRLKSPVEKTISSLGNPPLFMCDATDSRQVAEVYKNVNKEWSNIDFIVHSVAYAEREDLGGDFSSVSLQGFRTALEASAYSLIPVVKHGASMMPETGGSIITLTFDASVKVYPGYNIMGTAKAALENEVRQLAAEYGKSGIRINAISAGPLPTLSARSIPGFNEMRSAHQQRSPLQRSVSHEEVANTALFLISEMASGITGATLPVDAGFGIMAL